MQGHICQCQMLLSMCMPLLDEVSLAGPFGAYQSREMLQSPTCTCDIGVCGRQLAWHTNVCHMHTEHHLEATKRKGASVDHWTADCLLIIMTFILHLDHRLVFLQS